MKKTIFMTLMLLLMFVQSCSPTPASNETPLADEQEPWTVPAPAENMAVVYGELHSSTDEPVGDMVFLSQNLSYENPELPPTVSFSYQYSPRAIVDTARGYFYFENVEPAENYVVTILSGSGEFIFVTEADGKMPLMVSVEAGDSVDLGSLSVEMPDFN